LQSDGIITSAIFFVEIDFSNSRLSHIRLKLDQAKTLDGKTAETMMLATGLPQEIENILKTKYGNPVDHQGRCDNSIHAILSPLAEIVITCESTWGDNGQQVKSFWGYFSKSSPIDAPAPAKKAKQEFHKEEHFLYQIDYRPQPPSL